MAFKDLNDYYEAVKTSYFKMFNVLQEYDKHYQDGVLKDKEFKRFEKNVNKLKAPYESAAYFFMLWSRPDEKEKRKMAKWEKKYGKTYNYLADRSADKIIKRNEALLDEIKAYVEKLEKDHKDE